MSSSSRQDLAQTLDFILNRCNEGEIDIVAAAVVRRRRDIAMFGSVPVIPNAGQMAKELSSQLDIEGSIENLRNSVKEYAMRIIKQEAPELSDEQINELCQAWIPEKTDQGQNELPRDVLSVMVEQFISFSLGKMSEEEENSLRKEMGAWPEKYWKGFPKVIRLLITDFLKGEVDETDFRSRMEIALSGK